MGFGETGEDVNVGCLKDKEVKYPMNMEDGFDDDTFSDFIAQYKKVSAKARKLSMKRSRDMTSRSRMLCRSAKTRKLTKKNTQSLSMAAVKRKYVFTLFLVARECHNY